MSRPPPPAANASARLPQPTRRLVLGAAGLPLVPDAQAAIVDPAVEACETFLARRAEHERLGRRWQAIETRLFEEHNWPRLTRTQRKRFPEKHEMDDLYDRMDVLHAQNQALLATLPAVVATTHLGICGKLAVAALEVCPEDHPEAHQLLASILRDYRALHGG